MRFAGRVVSFTLSGQKGDRILYSLQFPSEEEKIILIGSWISGNFHNGPIRTIGDLTHNEMKYK